MQTDTLKAPIKIESYLLGPILNNIQEGFGLEIMSIYFSNVQQQFLIMILANFGIYIKKSFWS